eukprot:3208489-Prymnesium_polylepis.1
MSANGEVPCAARCPGLWDFVAESEVADIVDGCGAWADPVAAAAALRDEAFSRGTGDNTSVIIVHVA